MLQARTRNPRSTTDKPWQPQAIYHPSALTVQISLSLHPPLSLSPPCSPFHGEFSLSLVSPGSASLTVLFVTGWVAVVGGSRGTRDETSGRKRGGDRERRGGRERQTEKREGKNNESQRERVTRQDGWRGCNSESQERKEVIFSKVHRKVNGETGLTVHRDWSSSIVLFFVKNTQTRRHKHTHTHMVQSCGHTRGERIWTDRWARWCGWMPAE